eukprot:gb/GECG01002797.1/.p1 GENE.gb/GECG01002797.1/~~gb/GECG01002797.1/.p1  ORF type:complete len:110 (+),score=7.05 gb/GECG01002797.1/:1-330(+)
MTSSRAKHERRANVLGNKRPEVALVVAVVSTLLPALVLGDQGSKGIAALFDPLYVFLLIALGSFVLSAAIAKLIYHKTRTKELSQKSKGERHRKVSMQRAKRRSSVSQG